ncbi:MAG: hypothetical protein H0V12_10435 [Chloroflexi bacterium]|nr:hypothetical protein [Chloroflexota bacterium]
MVQSRPRDWLIAHYARMPAEWRPHYRVALFTAWRTRAVLYRWWVLSFFVDRLGRPEWQRRLDIRGWENLEAARAAGAPVILATLHFGTVPLLPYWLSTRGLVVGSVVKDDIVALSPVRQSTGRATFSGARSSPGTRLARSSASCGPATACWWRSTIRAASRSRSRLTAARSAWPPEHCGWPRQAVPGSCPV